MATQTAANVLVAIKRETTTGTAAGATSATSDIMRIIDSPGLSLTRAQVLSAEKRKDLVLPMGRAGGKTVTGSYNMEATVGGATDMLLESILRSTWVAAVAITQTEMTSITTTSTTIEAAAGSWITEGVKVGDIVRLTTHSTAANNDINLRVITVGATTLTIAGTAPLVADAAPDATFTLTILKKVKTDADVSPVRYSHTIEQYDTDVDLSELFLGCRLVGLSMSFRPGQMATLTPTFLGMDRTALVTGTSPYFIAPVLTTGVAMLADDSTITYNGVNVATLTGFDLNFQITAAGQPVIGSLVTPDVFDNDLQVSGTITGLRSDFSNLTLYDAETEFGVGISLVEAGTAPVGSLGVWIPRAKIGALSAPVGGGDGAKIETLELLVGPHAGSTSEDDSVVLFHSTAA